MEFFRLTVDEGSYRPLGKLDHLHSKKKFSAENGRVQTVFRGGPILTEPSTPVTYDLHKTSDNHYLGPYALNVWYGRRHSR